ncbi:hypothetical protein SOMG_01707 [Schizosaccharomyces osmophilus]|uniref:Mug135-like C-terminal domain-containing protein n=1 Tax=Schizosaccharomyces osmophilus TaxID=2545709 RepID=A0AAE9WAL9_9SCHI|nr:uncharacterized protein SOMG_01707 [Schizosaccharomyces osmophilus]WBW72370.1 hypothetical protein SOMG_01707 [Schizosaccharomyces osmophilus]
MDQELFKNPFEVAPPSDDSFASLEKFTYELVGAVPQKKFNRFRSKLINLYKALASKLEEEAPPQDDMSEIREMLQDLREDMSQELNEKLGSLRKDVESMKKELQSVDAQMQFVDTNSRGYYIDITSKIKENNSEINKARTSAQRSENTVNRVIFKDTKPVPFINGQKTPSELPELRVISDIDNLNPSQLKTYLEGYGGKYEDKEPQASLKRKLADHVGFVTSEDSRYEFSDNNEPLSKYAKSVHQTEGEESCSIKG